ncbi:MAG: hypothetical protein JXK94_01010 [Deltaproteobacteria bacterium]|nr:hypothetical protein [Deltaproteobacteria bacterium]
MNSSQKRPANKKRTFMLWAVFLLFLSGVLALTHDIIITNILAWQICRTDPNPKTFIKKTVELPESIYWEDNIYPGFDEKDRLLMIRNYLDGVHLKTMALNSPDGTIYLYTATDGDWKTSREIKARKIKGNFMATIEAEAEAIAKRGLTFTRKTMPQLNFNVVFNFVNLTSFQSRYLFSDDVTITDNKTNEILAYNRRLMRRWYLLMPDVGIGQQFYYPVPKCGERSSYGFDEKVFPIWTISAMKHLQHENNQIYMLFIGDEQ